METSLGQALLIALFVGAASGSIGAFVILKRMALVGDALSHVALPGIAAALAYGIDPFWGVVVSLLAAAFIIWKLEDATKLPVDAIVGLLFTASLAIGILTIPDTEIVESLFGEFPLLPLPFLLLVLFAAALMTTASFILARKFLFAAVSPEMARAGGITRAYDLSLLLIFSAVVALGIKLVGVLLMGALTVIPASVAKNLSRSMKTYMMLSAVLGGAISVIGVFLAESYNFLPGPAIILFGVALFLLSLLIKR